MTDETRKAEEADSRRDFLGRAGKVAITAPAVSLLLAASSKSSQAQTASTRPG